MPHSRQTYSRYSARVIWKHMAEAHVGKNGNLLCLHLHGTVLETFFWDKVYHERFSYRTHSRRAMCTCLRHADYWEYVMCIRS